MKTRWMKRQSLLALGIALLVMSACEENGSDTKKCTTGHHMTENGGCEKNTSERCGKPDSKNVIDCTSHNNATNGTCSNGECVATECAADHHLLGGACAADSLTACGSATNDCTKLAGWSSGSCEDGKCAATSCKTDHCLKDNTCVDGAFNAEACGIEGGEQACKDCYADSDKRCNNGKCQWAECPQTVCYRDSECENADDRCGLECLNCKTAANASEGHCNTAGKCVITACNDGYHLSEKDGKFTCNLDTINACGSSDNNCTALDGWAAGECKQGNCHAAVCSEGYHLKSEEGMSIEFDVCVVDNVKVCGSEKADCTELLGWKEGACVDGQCQVTQCIADSYLCLNDNACVNGRGNAEACGVNGAACQRCLGANEDCIEGKCVEVECRHANDCTIFRGVVSMACSLGKCLPFRCANNYTEIDNTCKADCGGVTGVCEINEGCNTTTNACECAMNGGRCSSPFKCCQFAVGASLAYGCVEASGTYGGIDYVCP